MSEEQANYEVPEDEDVVSGKLEEALEMVIEETITEWHDGNASDIEVSATRGFDATKQRETMVIESSWVVSDDCPLSDDEDMTDDE